MITSLPLYITVVFIITVLLTLALFVKAVNHKVIVAVISVAWLILTGALAYNGFYKDTNRLPPNFLLAIVPAPLAIILLFTTKSGRGFIDNINLRSITILNVVRIPVELVLYWLSVNKAVPELMTFTGSNFDIFSGLTAPVMYFVCFKGKFVTKPKILLVWNFICLALLLNVVVRGILSAPLPFQKIAFSQPNIAVLYFPFVWLPCFIVMAVLLSHLTSIRRLLIQ